MKTQLPESIRTADEAKNFITDLESNNELWHPEDDPQDVIWASENKPSKQEIEQLIILQNQFCSIDGFDPCEFIVNEFFQTEEE